MEGRIRPAITWQWAEGAVPYMAGRMAESVPHGINLRGAPLDNENIGINEVRCCADVNSSNEWRKIHYHIIKFDLE